MSNAFRLKSGTALVLALGLGFGAFTPMITAAPVVAQTQTQTQFTDVSSGYWARQFITSLAERNIIAGFPDGTFRPDEPVTRAQFAAMVRQAFNQSAVRGATSFVDVPANYWAAAAISEANMMGFLSGYPGNVFRPNENIPRAQVLVSLSNGLNYTASNQNSVQVYRDAAQIPQYAVASLAAATERRMVVNYPDVQALRPNQTATRADVAAFIYQALASQNQVATVNSPYIVGQQQAATQSTVPAGTVITTNYEQSDKVVVLPDETAALTLNVTQAVTDSTGRVLIPVGSQVVGELRPSANGSQFVAQELVLPGGQRMAINATSQTVTTRETIRQGGTFGETLAGAVLGSGAAAAIARTTGDQRADALEVLAGTATGATLGRIFGRNQVDVIAINPARDLSLTVNAPLMLSGR
ncbi:S-layer homology domain-containing protein [Pseudanabaena sp. FACHB-2040]|uniref:S-layer homology domain-containing protein n=1 Tax=Pseudanabaena sp. FACHB-2040 TaxID=2692859 RepID=UPI001688E402|nr:S-layer homology domain-containing protein [Pseudanabaena sp. FACHB-2040]MBD2256374.1 S-layer homology domain-containing protein [Pseudanabaena sp. FACHB-2040]